MMQRLKQKLKNFFNRVIDTRSPDSFYTTGSRESYLVTSIVAGYALRNISSLFAQPTLLQKLLFLLKAQMITLPLLVIQIGLIMATTNGFGLLFGKFCKALPFFAEKDDLVKALRWPLFLGLSFLLPISSPLVLIVAHATLLPDFAIYSAEKTLELGESIVQKLSSLEEFLIGSPLNEKPCPPRAREPNLGGKGNSPRDQLVQSSDQENKRGSSNRLNS